MVIVIHVIFTRPSKLRKLLVESQEIEIHREFGSMN